MLNKQKRIESNRIGETERLAFRMRIANINKRDSIRLEKCEQDLCLDPLKRQVGLFILSLLLPA